MKRTILMFWKKEKIRKITTICILAAIALIAFSQYQSPKSLWEWMQLLIVPAALTLGVFLLNHTNNKTEREITEKRYLNDQQIAQDKQREDLLQSYLDRISDLLLKEDLRTSLEVRNVARVRTLTALAQLDTKRNNYVLSFLREAKLVTSEPGRSIVDFSKADLREMDLRNVNLSDIDLSGANLSGINLSGANLSNTNLNSTNLSGANFSKANLMFATLRQARIENVDFSGATLFNADFSNGSIINSNLSDAFISGNGPGSANLRNTYLIKVNLSKAGLNCVYLSNARLQEVNLSGANLSEADLQETRFEDVNLNNANLRKAHLNRAKFSNVQIENTDFSDAVFKDSNIEKALHKTINISQGH